MKPTERDPWGFPRETEADYAGPPWLQGDWRNESIAGKCYHERRLEREAEENEPEERDK